MKQFIRRRVDNIPTSFNQTYLDSQEDINWVFEVHLSGVETTLTPHSVTAVILHGNEDSPDSVWVTTASQVLFDSYFTRLLQKEETS